MAAALVILDLSTNLIEEELSSPPLDIEREGYPLFSGWQTPSTN